MSEQEPPALWEEALEGDIPDADERVANYLDELWKRYKDDIPWADSPPGPD